MVNISVNADIVVKVTIKKIPLPSREIIYMHWECIALFLYITMMELQLNCDNVEEWVRQDPRFSDYLKQALLKHAIATIYVKDGQEMIPERKTKLITYFKVGWIMSL